MVSVPTLWARGLPRWGHVMGQESITEGQCALATQEPMCVADIDMDTDGILCGGIYRSQPR